MFVEDRQAIEPTTDRAYDRSDRRFALALTVLVCAWPDLSIAILGVPASYPLVTAIFTLTIAALVLSWTDDHEAPPAHRITWTSPPVIVAGALAATSLAVALYRWTRLMALQPYAADMLIVIREATRRFLNGHSPYTVYRSYDTGWDIAMPYGPALWGPYIVPQLLRFDFRTVTIVGELFVPLWCGIAALVEANRGRIAAAVSWLSVLAALVLLFDVQRFTWIGHTPVYWPLLALFAVVASQRRWVVAGCLLGLLVAARTTMVAIVPVFLMAVWSADRGRLPAVLIALAIATLLPLVPFIAWDPRAFWDSMVLSYPRVMKAAVWPELARPGMQTIGVTEWLLERGRSRLVLPVQAVTMSGVYVAAWTALVRGRPAVPWMALSLFAFSMTTFWPVHYLYYDVLLLLVAAALAGTFTATPLGNELIGWTASIGAVAALMFAAIHVVASPYPRVTAADVSSARLLRSGFATAERDGGHYFAWIVGHEARIVLPRSSASPADIVVTAQSPFEVDQPPQRMTAILNGTLLTEKSIPAGWQQIRMRAPSSAWWIGFNELRLVFASTISPREVGAGEDPRPLALAVSQVDVVASK